MSSVIRSVKQFLRSPKLIVGELVAVALLSALGAAIPQQGTATDAELERLHQAGPVVSRLIDWLGVDHIFRMGLFIAVAALTSASLLVVIFEQLKRLRLQWAPKLTETHFRSAPFREEFELSPGPSFAIAGADARVRIWTERRVGLLGSPIFHIGLLLLIVAGALQALFGTSAVVKLMEGETLAPVASAWSGQFPGFLGKQLQLALPVTLNAVKMEHYTNGELRDLRVELALLVDGTAKVQEIAVNHDLKIHNARLFLGSDFGLAALIECRNGGTTPQREAVLLAEQGANVFAGMLAGQTGWIAHLRVRLGADGARPGSVDIRVMKGTALVFAGEAAVGQSVTLPSGETLTLRGMPFWARLRGSRDCALWLVYGSFALVLVGVVLMFTVVKVDFCVAMTSVGEKARVLVALRPHRLAPLFQERFEDLVREQKAAFCDSSVNGDVKILHRTPVARWLIPTALHAVRSLLVVVVAGALTGCNESPKTEARRLVERYNEVVSEAYRRGDVSLVEPVAGPNEGKKLLGLIGVRMDSGITLDPQLISLEVTGVEKVNDEMRVQTKERWKYRDRKIGTGAMVGEESNDYYEMLYLFKKINKVWLVDELRFTSEPRVSRTKLPFPTDRKNSLGNISGTPMKEEKP